MAQPQLDLAHFRRRLEEMRASIQDEIGHLDEEITDFNDTESVGGSNHPADDASNLFTRQRGQAIEAQLERELQLIEHALERIDEGSYGICEVGGEIIAAERLEARPMATLCIQHQRERDEELRETP